MFRYSFGLSPSTQIKRDLRMLKKMWYLFIYQVFRRLGSYCIPHPRGYRRVLHVQMAESQENQSGHQQLV